MRCGVKLNIICDHWPSVNLEAVVGNNSFFAMVRIFLFLVLMCSLACSSRSHCKPDETQKLHTSWSTDRDLDGFDHWILVEGLSRNCDSITVMTAINSYIKNTFSDTPIIRVIVFNSWGRIERGENPFVDGVVEVFFNKTDRTPIKFVFFNDYGEIDYEGVRWK